ncbi:ABC-type multidrug/protein/lipid transport system ATPase component [Metamycoplasma cloacale]|nr:ABC-type multidrug/protein/lipid transport system ATPase component [Metamycoplasma cloacale]
MIKYHFHKWIDIDILKSQTNLSENGLSVEKLLNLSYKNGFHSEAYEVSLSEFLELKINKPIITILQRNNYFHYVIVISKTKQCIKILDSSIGLIKMTIEDFEKEFQGIIIDLIKIKDFSHTRQSIFDYFQNVKISKFLLILLFNLISQCCIILATKFMTEVIDSVWIPKKLSPLLQISIVFMWVYFVKLLSYFLSNFIKQRLINRLICESYNRFFHILLNIKLREFQKLHKSDYLQRMSFIPMVVTFQITFLITIFNSSFFILLSIIWMNIISWELFLIALCFVFWNVIITLAFYKRNSKLFPKMLHLNQNLLSHTNSLIFNVISNKNPNTKAYNKNEINTLVSNLFNFNKTFYKTEISKNVLFILNDNIFNVLLIVLGSILGYYNNLALGNMILFHSFHIYLINPIDNLLNLITNWKQNIEMINKLNFFYKLDLESNNEILLDQKISNIDFRNIHFNFGDKNLFKNFNLSINTNTFLKGSNGSGKSSLMHLIYGLYDDYQGEMKVNNLSLKTLNLNNYRDKIYFNINNEIFSRNSVLIHITQNNENLLQTFILNIQKYNLFRVFERYKLNLDSMIEFGGINLSSGQKQLIKICLLFTKKFELIMLDEAFENIDQDTFNLLKSAINDFQNESIFIEISHNEKYIKDSSTIKYL